MEKEKYDLFSMFTVYFFLDSRLIFQTKNRSELPNVWMLDSCGIWLQHWSPAKEADFDFFHLDDKVELFSAFLYRADSLDLEAGFRGDNWGFLWLLQSEWLAIRFDWAMAVEV